MILHFEGEELHITQDQQAEERDWQSGYIESTTQRVVITLSLEQAQELSRFLDGKLYEEIVKRDKRKDKERDERIKSLEEELRKLKA